MRSSVRVAAVILSLAFSGAAVAGCATDDGDGDGTPVASDPSALGLVSRVDVTSAWLGKDDTVVVHWSVTNQGQVALSLPRWQVPSATIEENIFTVTRDGERVRYYGKLAKLLEP